ncbi:unnamed protein product [Polarella glacialis]|uniref:AB hydrolase-1 domain-containing protein n=1 Tax=Polarella glacialis TaxID=89957 RepID=A0A813H359_POLGL|nr:unnamed protein product [Polarella glacialis]
MSGRFWKIVGGTKEGGILVREGQDSGSAQLPGRLSTGAIVQELQQLQSGGQRLQYRLLSGLGPGSGWVSAKLSSGKELAVPLPREASPLPKDPGVLPLLVLLPSGGLTAEQGEAQFRPFLEAAASAGFEEQLLLHHFPDPPLDQCQSYDEVIDALAKRIEAVAHNGRSVVLLGHSLGCCYAYGLAKRLGSRCLKFYAVASRPPTLPTLDGAFGVSSWAELVSLGDAALLRGLVGAWGNRFLESYKDRDPSSWPKVVSDTIANVRRQYSSPCVPTGSSDVHVMLGDEPMIHVPIFVIAASQESPAGETPERCRQYEQLTTGSFQFEVVEADHFGCFQLQKGQLSNAAFDLILRDLWQLVI